MTFTLLHDHSALPSPSLTITRHPSTIMFLTLSSDFHHPSLKVLRYLVHTPRRPASQLLASFTLYTPSYALPGSPAPHSSLYHTTPHRITSCSSECHICCFRLNTESPVPRSRLRDGSNGGICRSLRPSACTDRCAARSRIHNLPYCVSPSCCLYEL